MSIGRHGDDAGNFSIFLFFHLQSLPGYRQLLGKCSLMSFVSELYPSSPHDGATYEEHLHSISIYEVFINKTVRGA